MAWNPGRTPLGVYQRTPLGVRGKGAPGAGTLYISGFNNPAVSGIPGLGISSYDGTNFHALGAGIAGTGYYMTKYNGNLYVTGAFTTAGGATANNIAYWDGSAWHSMGGGLIGLTKSGSQASAVGRRMCVCGGLLYIMGTFDQAGAISTTGVCCWDGSNFTDSGLYAALGIAVDQYAQMATDGTTVFVLVDNNSGAGYEMAAFGTQASGWTVVNSGGTNPDYSEYTNGAGDTIAFGGGIVAGGYFIDNSPGYIYPVTRSTGGSTWSRGGDSISFQQSSDFIACQCLFSDPAIAGGNLLALFNGYTSAGGGTPIANIYQWDGSSWTTLYPIPYPTPFGGVYAPRAQNLAQWKGKLWFASTDGSLGYWDPGTSAWVPVLNFPTGTYYQEGINCMYVM